jgi:hypothetical protein
LSLIKTVNIETTNAEQQALFGGKKPNWLDVGVLVLNKFHSEFSAFF